MGMMIHGLRRGMNSQNAESSPEKTEFPDLLYTFFIVGCFNYLLVTLCNWDLPIFPLCLFYSHSWPYVLRNLFYFHSITSIISLLLYVCFWVISILFIKSISRKIPSEEEFKEGIGKTSTGYKIGIASIVILSVQSIFNIIIANVMHSNLSGVSGEQAIGAALFAFILIFAKLLLDLVFLPAIPLSIVGIVKCNSKKEIEQDRKKRQLGKKINIICLVIAVAELVLVW